MSETRFTESRAFSVDPRVRISRSASETDVLLFFLPIIGKHDGKLRKLFGVKNALRRVSNVCKQLTSLIYHKAGLRNLLEQK